MTPEEFLALYEIAQPLSSRITSMERSMGIVRFVLVPFFQESFVRWRYLSCLFLMCGECI